MTESEAMDCRAFGAYVDAYVSAELDADTAEKVVRHTDICDPCSKALEGTFRLRTALRRAVDRGDDAPAELRDRIRAAIRKDAGSVTPVVRPDRRIWAGLAAAAALLLALTAGWVVFRQSAAPGGEGSIARRESTVSAPALEVGLKHHVHCIGTVPPPETPFNESEMSATLGPDFAGLVTAVQASVPGDLTLVDAHRCSSLNQKYEHLVLRRGSEIVSVLVTERGEGPLSKDDVNETIEETISRTSTLSYQRASVTGTALGKYMVYVVSSSVGINTRDLASAIGPAAGRALATRS